MNKCVHDDSFRKMAVELANSREFIKEITEEIGINPSLLSKWEYRELDSKQNNIGLTDDQKLIKKLQKELKYTQMERDILKKAADIFSRGKERYSDL